MSIHVNYAFCLEFAKGTTLDYGCGAGEIVAEGARRGLDIWGTDVFYAGGPKSIHGAASTGLLHDRIRPMQDGHIPFPDHTFDVVVTNQVFEHVPNLGLCLREIRRVLKPGGVLISLFPSKEVWREGHCGVPFAHRLSHSRLGYYWLLVFRLLGAGYNKNNKPKRQWARDFQKWLNDFCVYRSGAEVASIYSEAGFTMQHIEHEYIRYRFNRRLMPAWLFRRLGGMVILSR